MLIYPLGIPLMYAAMLYQCRDYLGDSKFMDREMATGFPKVRVVRSQLCTFASNICVCTFHVITCECVCACCIRLCLRMFVDGPLDFLGEVIQAFQLQLRSVGMLPPLKLGFHDWYHGP